MGKVRLIAILLGVVFINSAVAEFPYHLPRNRQKHLIHCPADSNSNKTFSKADWQAQINPKRDSNSLPLMALDIIYINSDITTNQIWTANNAYFVTADINVQALLVIEPGTEIRLAYGCTIYINNGGTLISCGRPNNPITYTSAYAYPMHGDYCCAICIEPTASPATKITYNFIEYAEVGIVTWDISLDTPIENNYFYSNDNGICQQGSHLTDIINNLVFDSYSCGVSIDMEYWDGIPEHEEIGDGNSHILIQNNTFEWQEDAGIAIFSTKDANNAGLAMLINNIVTDSGYGIYLCDPEEYIVGIVSNTGYGCNGMNKNWDFPEDNPVEAYEYPYMGGAAFYLDQNCPFVDAGLGYIEETPLIGKTTNIDGMPDSNIIDIGFHHPNWQFSNAGTGDYYAGDLDENLIVDFRDFAILANGWRQTYDINDLAQMCGNWLKTGGPEPNIIPVISGDPNSGYVNVGAIGFASNTQQVFLLVDGKYVGEIPVFEVVNTVGMDISESGDHEQQLKLVVINGDGHITCSDITNVAFLCPLNYCFLPSSYEPNKPCYFAAYNSGEEDVSVKVYADGGDLVWSQTYSANNVLGSIPAEITNQHEIDYINFDMGGGELLDAGGGASILKIIDPVEPPLGDVQALIIVPNFQIRIYDRRSISQVAESLAANGITYKKLRGKFATYDNVAWYAANKNIKYMYIDAHGNYKLTPNGVLRTCVRLYDGSVVSIKQSDFAPGGAPSWCQQLEYNFEKTKKSFFAMGFNYLEFVYFDCCYSGHLKINASNQLVEGQPGQIGVFDGPHSDMSLALGIGNPSRSRVYQGWYEEVPIRLLSETEYQKWTRLEWEYLGDGYDLYWALMYVINEQTDFGPHAPVNNYRLKGQGLLTDITLSRW